VVYLWLNNIWEQKYGASEALRVSSSDRQSSGRFETKEEEMQSIGEFETRIPTRSNSNEITETGMKIWGKHMQINAAAQVACLKNFEVSANVDRESQRRNRFII